MKTLLMAGIFFCTAWANQTLINLPADSWYTATNTKMSAVCDPSDNAYQCQSVQTAWSGGTYDPVGKRMIVWGGGHVDSPDNAVYCFNIATLSWRREINSTGSSASQDPLPNGDPAARHTYDGVAFLTHANRMFEYGGSQAGNGYGTSVTWTLDMAAKTWSNMKPAGSHGPTTDCCNFSGEYDPISKLVFMHDPNNLYTYDYDNNRWTIALVQSEGWSAHKGVVDTKRRLYFTIGSGELLVYDIVGKKEVTSQWTAANNSSATGGGYAAAGYDTKADKIVVWKGGAPWVLDLDAKTWTQKSGTGAPGSGLSNGTFGRFRYIPEDNVFILVNGIDQDVRFYKHTAGAGAAVEYASIPEKNALSVSATPNPCSGRVSLKITGKTGSIRILGLNGRLAAELIPGPGRNECIWETGKAAPGIYLVQAGNGKLSGATRLLLVR